MRRNVIAPEVEVLLTELKEKYPRAAIKIYAAWEHPNMGVQIFEELLTYQGPEQKQGFDFESFTKIQEIYEIFKITFDINPHKHII